MKVNINKAAPAILNLLREIAPELIDEATDYNRVVVPKIQAWGTYKIRYENKLRTNKLKAKELYEKTLGELKEFDEELVSIHAFNPTGEGLIVIFSDVTDSNIIGYIIM